MGCIICINLTDDQAHFLTAVADTYRLDLNVLNDLDGGAWGEYVEILNKINLSAKSDMFSSFVHETGHLINRWAPEKWAKIEAGFKDYMIEKYGMQRLSYLMDDAIARYDGKISDSAALTEVVCDHLEAIRNTKTFAEDFAKVLGENGYSQSRIKQVFKDISDFFRRMADVIRGWMKGGAKTKAGIFASQDAEYCEKLASDWLDAMENVRTEYTRYADGESAEVGIRSSEADTGVKKMIVAPFYDNNGNYYENVVLLDTNFFNGVSPRNWGSKLKTFVESRAENDPFIMPVLDERGNKQMIQFAGKKERTGKHGKSHKVIAKLYETKDNISKLSVVHIDEIVNASEPNNPYFTDKN